MQELSEEAYSSVVCAHVQEHIASRSEHVFDEGILAPALQYAATVPMHFLRLVLPQEVCQGDIILMHSRPLISSNPLVE